MTPKQRPKIKQVSLCLLFCVTSNFPTINCQAGATTLSVGTDSSANFTPPKATFAPEPLIPEHLHEQCFKSCCIAKFMVSPSGKSDVQLVGSSGSQEVDDITLETLRRWKFKPATIDGAPVEATKKVQVEFKVEE